MPLDDKVQAALDTIFTADSELYANRGWNVRSGFGKRPALLNIDLANAWTEIDDRVAPETGIDTLIVKKRPSAFAGTHLAGILRAGNIDTLICTGVTLAGCVRHTVEDALGEGFRTVVVRECVGDRVPAAIEWNLFDIDMKYSDVEPIERVLAYLTEVRPADEAA